MSDYEKTNGDLGERTKHPSYGTLSFSRVSGGNKTLFGSSIKHRDTILLTLRHADIERGLNNDWFYGDKIIVEAEMSYSQFAEAITSMNMGTGVPVTLRLTEKDGRIPECDFVNKKEQFQDELKESLDKATEISCSLIEEVKQLFTEKKSLNKTDKEYIVEKLTQIASEINTNVSFTYRQFNKQMDKTVAEAKGEIEAFCQNKLNSIAQAALMEHKEEFEKLENPVDI